MKPSPNLHTRFMESRAGCESTGCRRSHSLPGETQMLSLGWVPMLMALAAPNRGTAGPADLLALTREYVAAYGTRSSAASFAHIPSFSRQTGLPCTACH